ncbi:hypothetical protein [Henriciella marina]|uniref:hypothetical protein n=1 Tax=Henriciella marina TaxID=453851 RepID=UPI00037A654F|nr:hypothetical protein [Henriciella marina]
MKTRVAALAFAALPLTALPALADEAPHRAQTAVSGFSLSVADASFYVSVGNDRYRGRDGRYYQNDRYGQRPWQTRQLRREAVRMCAAAIQRQGYRAGFRDVDIDNDLRVNQIGPKGFRVLFDDVEFEGRRREFYRDVNCTVRQGRVMNVTGLPTPGRRGQQGHDRGHHNNNGYDRGRSHNGRPYASTTYTTPPVTRTVVTTRTVNTNDRDRGYRGDRGRDGRRGN